MRRFIKSFLKNCLKSLATIGQSELAKWGYDKK